jgi:hypothetical protein
MHTRTEGIRVRAVSRTTTDHGTDPPVVPGNCKTPPMSAGEEEGGTGFLVILVDALERVLLGAPEAA